MLNYVAFSLSTAYSMVIGNHCLETLLLWLCISFLTLWARAVPNGFEHSMVFLCLPVSDAEISYFFQAAPPDLTLS